MLLGLLACTVLGAAGGVRSYGGSGGGGGGYRQADSWGRYSGRERYQRYDIPQYQRRWDTQAGYPYGYQAGAALGGGPQTTTPRPVDSLGYILGLLGGKEPVPDSNKPFVHFGYSPSHRGVNSSNKEVTFQGLFRFGKSGQRATLFLNSERDPEVEEEESEGGVSVDRLIANVLLELKKFVQENAAVEGDEAASDRTTPAITRRPSSTTTTTRRPSSTPRTTTTTENPDRETTTEDPQI